MRPMNLPRDFRGPRKILQIWVTRACDKACCNCTQGSNLGGRPTFITVDQFRQACVSLADYPGVIAMFGGNPCMHPQFEELCQVAQELIPYNQRGIWTNALMGKGAMCRATFNPRASNFNLHMDYVAAEEFRRDWPEATQLKGLDHDCRHPPPFVAIKDVIADEKKMWDKIETCDINAKWSAMVGVFRGELRGWFCEIAGAQSILHENDSDYPDTGVKLEKGWWKKGMESFGHQIAKHCPDCGVPLRRVGSLAVTGTKNQISETHKTIPKPKRVDVTVEVVDDLVQLGRQIPCATDYLGNFKFEE